MWCITYEWKAGYLAPHGVGSDASSDLQDEYDGQQDRKLKIDTSSLYTFSNHIIFKKCNVLLVIFVLKTNETNVCGIRIVQDIYKPFVILITSILMIFTNQKIFQSVKCVMIS